MRFTIEQARTGLTRPSCAAHGSELFLTNHEDENALDCVSRKIRVLSWRDYQQWRAQHAGDERALAEAGQTVFVCRRFLDTPTGSVTPLLCTCHGVAVAGACAADAAATCPAQPMRRFDVLDQQLPVA